jgi:hypothetical protein
MTSTPNAKAIRATNVRVVGFLALLAGVAALLVLLAAAAHGAFTTSSPKAGQVVGMHRAGAAPHIRHQGGALRKDDGRQGRPAHDLRAQGAADCRSGQQRRAHASSRTHLAAMRWTHKTVQRVQGAHHAHAQGPADLGWLL